MRDDPVRTFADTNPRRLELLARVTADQFRWRRVPLAGGATVEVSLPLKVDGVFLPVTAAEQLKLAKSLGLVPLTRAVADRCFNDAHAAGRAVPFRGFYPHLFDYDRFTRWLDTTAYGGAPQPWAFGAHKLWLASRHPNQGAVNYGFYHAGPAVRVEQGLGGRHNAWHWDYSQLLQLMRGLTAADGTALDLRAELLAGSPAVWDEADRPREADLP